MHSLRDMHYFQRLPLIIITLQGLFCLFLQHNCCRLSNQSGAPYCLYGASNMCHWAVKSQLHDCSFSRCSMCFKKKKKKHTHKNDNHYNEHNEINTTSGLLEREGLVLTGIVWEVWTNQHVYCCGCSLQWRGTALHHKEGRVNFFFCFVTRAKQNHRSI